MDYGQRPDGSKKAKGYLGELKLPGGGVATEYSVSVDDVTLDGKPVDFPTLVPTLTKSEVDKMVNDVIPNGGQVPRSVMDKAIVHAKERLKKGLSPFAGPDDFKPQIKASELLKPSEN